MGRLLCLRSGCQKNQNTLSAGEVPTEGKLSGSSGRPALSAEEGRGLLDPASGEAGAQRSHVTTWSPGIPTHARRALSSEEAAEVLVAVL